MRPGRAHEQAGIFNANHLLTTEEFIMNWDRIQGDWKQFKGNIKVRWGKLTDDELDVIAGKRDVLAGKIQEAYGISKEEAEAQVNEWQNDQRDDNRRF